MANFYFLNEDSADFPLPVALDGKDLAIIGSNLEPETILKAYKKGYFPWYNEGQPRCWFHPDPRMVLFPDELKISKSMRPVLNGNKFIFKIDKSFLQVITSCRYAKRNYGEGKSWISDEIIESYTRLFDTGFGHCAEAWHNGKLVGGLYGLRIGNVFFGESMFTTISNASKFAFIKYVNYLKSQGIRLIDCQQETRHLRSLGAKPVSRKEFTGYLERFIHPNDRA